MVYETIKGILCRDTKELINLGDIVNITTENGGGYGSCIIVKITDTGFHFNQGGSDKSIQYKKIREIKHTSVNVTDNEIKALLEITPLEKALNRLVIKSRVRNALPDSIKIAELNAMVNLLEAMGVEVDFEWQTINNKNIIVAISGEYNGEIIHKNV